MFPVISLVMVVLVYRRINQRGWILWRLSSRLRVFWVAPQQSLSRMLKKGTAAAENLGVSPQIPKLRPLWDCDSVL